jgi:two-component sensor histidine kinase
MIAYLYYNHWAIETENYQTQHEIDRIRAFITEEGSKLSITAQDWGTWDDTYNYIESRNTEYEESNLGPGTFETLQLSNMVFFNIDGKVVFRFASSLDSMISFVTPDFIKVSSIELEPITSILSKDGMLHFAALAPILRSDGSGLPNGFILLTRLIDASYIDKIQRITGLAVTTIPNSIQIMPPPIEKTSDNIFIVAPVYDYQGETSGYIRVQIPRTIIKFQVILLKYILVLSILIGLIFSTGLLIANTLVFKSIKQLFSELEIISKGKNSNARINVPKINEIGMIANVINTTLDNLEEQKKERESLFREINHRVKNNLQLIASLIGLQESSYTNADTLTALRNSKRRIHALAIAHEEITVRDNMSAINLTNFLDTFTRKFEPDSSSHGVININITSDEILLNPKDLIPLGLILSEAISNAYIHGFPEGKHGDILINAKIVDNSMLEIVIQDNGTGCDINVKQGIGLELVNSLAHQLGGRMEFKSNILKGTQLSITIPNSDRINS